MFFNEYSEKRMCFNRSLGYLNEYGEQRDGEQPLHSMHNKSTFVRRDLAGQRRQGLEHSGAKR